MDPDVILFLFLLWRAKRGPIQKISKIIKKIYFVAYFFFQLTEPKIQLLILKNLQFF
jgi:uncharacterized membrane protein